MSTALVVKPQAHQGSGTGGQQFGHDGNSNLLRGFRFYGKANGAAYGSQFRIRHTLLAQSGVHLFALGSAADHAHILGVACQGLSQSLRDSIEGNIAAFDAMEQSGLLDNCRTLSKDATFREVFRNILLYILDSFHIYRHDISGKLVSYFHVTPESANANYKTWIATTGMDSYIKIEQTGSDKFKVTDVYRELKGNSLKKQSRDRDFSGRSHYGL